ncbi:Putative auto-transporter adhesin, head GIN domain [Chitinophaga arvensicola]|uniref:Putative auto-transporter adhesin, head GIN domain n=2 Tax=Chitinophaga arvensicola TaxID=29529 RepID=A0A1I0NKL0_9BACT|nr:Putative auto-transporter adhesin, head GIN domain [Chitinophaga arvensicola]
MMFMKRQFIITYTSLSIGWLLLMIAIFSIILSSCTKDNVSGSGNVVTETRSTGPFTDVEISGPFEVHLVQEQNAAVKIKAEDNIISVIETGMRSTTLFVRIKNRVSIKHHQPIHIYVHNPLFQRIKFDGSGSLDNQDTIHTSLFKYELNGSANAALILDASNLNTTINGSGNINMRGFANTFISDINGSGNVSAMNLEVQTATVTIRGSGEHALYVRKNLDARIFGSGNIFYTGEARVISSVKGSGKIVKQ